MTDPRLPYALGYIARGWHVFVLSASKVPIRNCNPCDLQHQASDAKEACDCLTCHGFYAATTDPDRVTTMLQRHPRGLLAIRTGAVSNLAVVDFDFHKWHNGSPAADDDAFQTMTALDRRKLLPGTLMQTTGSGGLHMLYAHPGDYVQTCPRIFGPGVDSKADGGYIVAAPSVSKSGPYSWTPDGRYDHELTVMPDALAEIARPKKVERRAPVLTPWARPGQASSRLAGLVKTVLEAPDGKRNDCLHWAAKKVGAMVAAGEIDQSGAVDALIEAGTAIGLTPNEIGDEGRGTIASGLRKGLVMA